MISFLVGLLVLIVVGLLSVAGLLLLPLLLVLGFFLRFLIGFALILFTIWLIGKVTLLSIDSMRKSEERKKRIS